MVYALLIPITESMAVGPRPAPTAAFPATVLLLVTNGYVPWSTSSSVPWAPSKSTALPRSTSWASFSLASPM